MAAGISPATHYRTHPRNALGLLALVATACVLAGVGCASSNAPPDEPQREATVVDPDPFNEWASQTRIVTEQLLDEARRSAELGDADTALDLLDEALGAALDPPEPVAENPAYLAFVAELLTDAQEVEDLLAMDDEDRAAHDMVALPPIDLPEAPTASQPPADANGLPASAYPLVMNESVERFLEAMSGSGEYRRRIATGLERAGPYLPMIRSKLEAAGLPAEIAYLPLIESAFSVKAYSRARAHGMWQFMSGTGRFYGLEIGALVDERRDPVRSTDAAVAYLGDLFDQFNDWHLALAAYNSGAGNVRRAIRRSGSRDFWTLKRYLPRETRNYVPAFIASVIIAKNPEKYGFSAPDETPWEFDRIEVPDALDLQFLADTTSLDLDLLRQLNPAIRRDLTPAKTATHLWLPPGTASAVEAALAEHPRKDWAPRLIHTVRSGESLSTIAARYGSNVSAVRQANGIRGSLIHPGQNLIVPRLGIATSAPRHRAATGDVYVVQSNDTLWDIARSFSISVAALCDANGLSKRSVIHPGLRLRLPAGASGGGNVRGSAPSGSWSGSYTVRSGDTLSAIASRYRVSVTDLLRANNMRSSRIYPGNTLKVPAAATTVGGDASTYLVRRGDTLYDIARQFGVSISELRRLNGLSSSRIYPGDVLRIPKRRASG